MPFRRRLITATLAALLLIILFIAEPIIMSRLPSLPSTSIATHVRNETEATASPPPPPSPSTSQSLLQSLLLIVKTGRETYARRLPMQRLTFLTQFPNIMYIADKSLRIGVDTTIHGVLDRLPPTSKSLAARGWDLDAWKNLPGFGLSSQLHPSSEWIFMIDDDTYVFRRNLLAFLEREFVNETAQMKPVYTGLLMRFVGCDNITTMAESPKSTAFAHGGAGILMNAKARQELVEGLDGCVANYDGCFGGDIRTGLCLRDRGVPLLPRHGFIHHAPSTDPLKGYVWPEPCRQPVTFHHVLDEQHQQLWEFEEAHGDRESTYADLFHHLGVQYRSSNETGYNRFGGDYRNVTATSADQCMEECLREGRCEAWTHESPMNKCFLKVRAMKAYDKMGATSGLIADRYKCTAVSTRNPR